MRVLRGGLPRAVGGMAIVLLVVSVGPAQSQTADDARSGHLWFSLVLGPAEAVRALDDLLSESHPRPSGSRDTEINWSARLGYRQSRWLDLALVVGRSSGELMGGFTDDVDHSLHVLATTANLRVGPLSVGAGPALYRLRASIGGQDAGGTRLGILLDVGLRYRVQGPAFLEVRYERRTTGDFTAGPWQGPERTVSERRVGLGHGFLAAGFGIEFR